MAVRAVSGVHGNTMSPAERGSVTPDNLLFPMAESPFVPGYQGINRNQ